MARSAGARSIDQNNSCFDWHFTYLYSYTRNLYGAGAGGHLAVGIVNVSNKLQLTHKSIRWDATGCVCVCVYAYSLSPPPFLTFHAADSKLLWQLVCIYRYGQPYFMAEKGRSRKHILLNLSTLFSRTFTRIYARIFRDGFCLFRSKSY